MANIALDEITPAFVLGGGNAPWSTRNSMRNVGGAEKWPQFAENTTSDTGPLGTAKITFNGTSIALFGTTPLARASQSFGAQVDTGTKSNNSYGSSQPSTTGQWYQSPVLANGVHTLSIDRLAGPSLDYAVVAAGPETPLKGFRLLVDDADPDFGFSGNWTQTVGQYNDSSTVVFPYGNKTHASGTAGSSATLRFYGSSPCLFAGLSSSNSGSVTVRFTLYDRIWSETYHRAPKQLQLGNVGNIDAGSFRLFINDSLPVDFHTFKLEIVEAVDQMFMVDFFTYLPAFEKPSVKPNANAFPAPLVTASSLSSAPTASSPSSNTGSDNNSSTPVGAIAGGVVGGVVGTLAVVGLIALWLLLRKRRARKASERPIATHMVEPFMANDEPASPYKPSLLSLKSGSSSINALTPPNTPPYAQHKPGGPVILERDGDIPQPEAVMLPQHKPSAERARNIVTAIAEDDGMDGEGVPPVSGGGPRANRRQRVRELVLELQREIAEVDDESFGIDRADLHRRDTVSSGVTIPPPYEKARQES